MAIDDSIDQDSDASIIDEAKTRFDYALSWESHARKMWLDDYKFANGDSENLYQWPEDIRTARETQRRPNMTINKVRVHNNLIINDAKQNKPSVKFRPVSDDASAEAAEVFESIVRHIEYQSKAEVAYDTATSFQVQAGIGYVRVETDWAGDETFDQEIFIRRVKDPLMILMDPDAQEADYSDMRFCFVFEDVPRDRFDTQYPEFQNIVASSATFGTSSMGEWLAKDHVRVAEYWRRVDREDELVLYFDAAGKPLYSRKSKIPRELYKALKEDPRTKTRNVSNPIVQHFFIVGSTVVRRESWAGKYIPIVPVIGEEIIIEHVMDRRGHTRMMRDPQRMYNYWSSEATYQIALQSKTPYIASAAAIEGHESYWETANTVETAVLPWNHKDDDGKDIPPPSRQQGPMMAPAYLQGMEVANNEIMDVSGQRQAQLGAPSNERSGRAIAERQRQGDTTNYHFIDGLAIAVRQVGRIILDLVPHIYDQERTMLILGQDGSERQVMLDPAAQRAYEKEATSAQEIFNPNVGKYDVHADIGPAYSTQRQEAWNAFVQIVTQAPQLMQIIGDLLFKVADFPLSDEIAERLKRTIDPGILGEGLPPPIQALAQQATEQIRGLMAENADLKAKLQGAAASLTQKDLQLTATDSRRLTDAYRAQTDRLKALNDKMPVVPPQELAMLAAQLIMDALKTPMGAAAEAAAADLTRDAGVYGQEVAPEGQALAQGGDPSLPSPPALPPSSGPQNASSVNPNQHPVNDPRFRGVPAGAAVPPDGTHAVPDPNNPGQFLPVR